MLQKMSYRQKRLERVEHYQRDCPQICGHLDCIIYIIIQIIYIYIFIFVYLYIVYYILLYQSGRANKAHESSECTQSTLQYGGHENHPLLTAACSRRLQLGPETSRYRLKSASAFRKGGKKETENLKSCQSIASLCNPHSVLHEILSSP